MSEYKDQAESSYNEVLDRQQQELLEQQDEG